MIRRSSTVIRTLIVAAIAAGVALAAVAAGKRDGPSSHALGDAPAGVSAGPAVRGLPQLTTSRKGESPIVQTVTPTLSLALRDVLPAPVQTLPPVLESNEPDLPAPPVPETQPHDPVVQSSPGVVAIPPPIATFEGLSNDDNPNTDPAMADLSFVIPPDTEGDIGPNHYVEWINISFAIYNRSGTKLVGPLPGNSLFSALPSGKCKTTNTGDPLVLHDQLADRWVLTQFTGSASPFFQCVAVSTTPDPTGTYCLYPFQVSTTVFNDYPKIGIR